MWPAEMERKSSYLMNGTAKVIETGPILRLLGGKKAYERFVLEGISESHNEEYYAVEDQRFLGEEGFGEELSREAGEKEERKTKVCGLPRQKRCRLKPEIEDQLNGMSCAIPPAY